MPEQRAADGLVLQAFEAILSGSFEQRKIGLSILARLEEEGGLDDRQRDEVALGQVLAAQMDGQHRVALEMLDRYTPSSESAGGLARRLRRNAVGTLRLDENIAETILPGGAADCPVGEPPGILGYLHLERGNAAFHGRDPAAAELWNAALESFIAAGEEPGRAYAIGNLGMLLISGQDPEEHERGVDMINTAITLKYALDDAAGLAADCMNLAQFFAERQHRFERAIAHSHQAVFFARVSGDRRILAQAHHDRGLIKLVMGQLTQARADGRACIELAAELRDARLVAEGQTLLDKADQYGRKGWGFSPRHPCRCESGRPYVSCCGRADHEPIEVGLLMPGHALAHDASPAAPLARGERPILLDLQMRRDEGARFRRGWARVTRRDGWFELGEMPDMASQHLLAARRLTELVPGGGVQPGVADLDVPVAACILGVCAIEAFANSVAFFVHEAMREGEIPLATVPPALATSSSEFVRNTELRQKWRLLEQVLCAPGSMEDRLSDRFDKLVTIRNELVHFKTPGFEKVAPTPAGHHPFLGLAAGEFEIRDAPRSWPVRLLTPAFGRWCVAVAEELIDDFRTRYGARFGEPA
ncbi:hypothetical protein [Methylorubrum extorquens]|uniref:SEC-C motif domain protein n=1 Tax=Methylorubrum extorquens (strain CM4 / NCIMB 13688) TaxID=440085 RepID=B7L2V8_METC4|nr:hypothetical protein [Methylorubrum extorquens]ACK86166.1 hypothetical protein Mchl_5408 [Methylorubrum extorquens CM4]